MPEPAYVVFEVEGWPIYKTGGSIAQRGPGLTCGVYETTGLHRCVALWRTEDLPRPLRRWRKYAYVRRMAQAECDRLNALYAEAVKG